jgi:glucose-1-phosphate cytidylyltransferase
VTLVYTGETTQTGGRLRRVRQYLDDTFCLTYGDGLSDVDIDKLVAFHKSEGVQATVTAVQPAGRYGALDIVGSRVQSFMEKPKGDGQWVSGGFFVCEPTLIDRISGDDDHLEGAPLEGLAAAGQLSCWRHHGFWAAMDTLRDKQQLERMWESGNAPWKTWT